MRFKEGLYITGSVEQQDGSTLQDVSLVNSGTIHNEGNITVTGDLEVSQYIRHIGDSNTNINFTDDKINLKAGNISMITMEEKSSAPHEVRINNGGNNIDFNVEDNSGNVYFTADASTSRIGIGTETPSEKLTINTPNDADEVFIQFQEAGSDRAILGINSSNNLLIQNQFTNKHIVFKVNDQGVTREGLRIDGAVPEVVVNEGSESLVDFRVESDNQTHMLFVDGASDKVGIGTSAPSAEAMLDVNGNLIVSGNLHVNLEATGEALKIVGTLDHNSSMVFEQPAGSNRASIGLDGGDNLDIINNSSFDDINFFTTSGAGTDAAMVLTSVNKVGIGKFGWAGKAEFGTGEVFPRDELDVSGSMRVSENVELMGQQLVVSGTVSGRYVDAIPGHALIFKNTEHYFLTTDADVDNKVMAPDENIFFSGSIGSKNTTTKGTAVFGGDVVISGSLSAIQKHVVTVKYTETSANGKKYIRWDSNGSNDSPGVNNKWLAPAPGNLSQVIIRSTHTPGQTTLGFHRAVDGAENVPTSAIETQSVDLSTANTSKFAAFSPNANFGPGDIVGFSVDPTNNHGNVNITFVFELDFVI